MDIVIINSLILAVLIYALLFVLCNRYAINLITVMVLGCLIFNPTGNRCIAGIQKAVHSGGVDTFIYQLVDQLKKCASN